jgi:type II secretory pathway pseudopilin PulG
LSNGHIPVQLKNKNPAWSQRVNTTQKECLIGFSLVELLVVIATIALLLSILTPALMQAKSIAMRTRCAHNLKQIYMAVNLYQNANDNTYPCADDPVSTEPSYWLWMGRGWRPFVQPYLGYNIDVNNPSVLLCPEDRTNPAKYESTSYSYSMAFYHSPEQIDNMNSIEDTYTNPQPSIPQKSFNVAHPSGKILIGEWLSNHYPIDEDKGWWIWQGSRNYTFADGQVHLLKAKQIRPARDSLPDANLTIHGVKGTDLSP